MGRTQNSVDQFSRAELLLMFTSSEGVHELNEQELRAGFESDHRDRVLRTLVRNVFSYHQQEIFPLSGMSTRTGNGRIFASDSLKGLGCGGVEWTVWPLDPCFKVALIHARRGSKTWANYFAHVSKEGGDANSFEVSKFDRPIMRKLYHLQEINS